MPTLHALLVGIADYPDGNLRLLGCINDTAEMHTFLKGIAEGQDWAYRHQFLRNEEATRERLIQTFTDHFQPTQPGDACVFYFSGHGSQGDAPKEFWYNANGKNESFVCFDSREAGGKDLMDKELAYLIWQATGKKKDVHFLVIADCCNSGSSTRSIKTARERFVPPHASPPRPDDYLGFENYHRRDNGELSPPMSPHVLLAACHDSETAKEDYLDDSNRGVFTYSLLKELKLGGVSMSYAELMNRVRIRVRQLAVQQNPQLEALDMDANGGFLGGKLRRGVPHLVYFQPEENAWLLDAGLAQNIAPPTAEWKTILELLDGTRIQVTEVNLTTSRIEGMGNKSRHRTYPAYLRQNALPPLPVFLQKDLPEAWQTELRKQFGNYPNIQVVATEAEARFVILPREGNLFFCRRGEAVPIFKRVEVRTTTQHGIAPSISTFLHDVAGVAKWESVLQMQSVHEEGLLESDLKVEFFRFQEPPTDALPFPDSEQITDLSKPVRLPYFFVGNKFAEPVWQMRVTNMNPSTPLFVSALYLSSNYAIEDAYLPSQLLQPKAFAWFGYLDGDEFENRVKATLENEYQTWGVRQISDYVKIFASPSQLNLSSHLQEAIKLDIDKNPRSTYRSVNKFQTRQPAPPESWLCKTAEIQIIRPLEEREVAGGQKEASLPGNLISAPAGFSAKVSLTSFADANRLSGFPPDEDFWRTESRSIMQLTKSFGSVEGLEVLEFIGATGETLLGRENPVVVKFRDDFLRMEQVQAFGFDKETGKYAQVGQSKGSNQVHIWKLPAKTPAELRSDGESAKVFFLKITEA